MISSMHRDQSGDPPVIGTFRCGSSRDRSRDASPPPRHFGTQTLANRSDRGWVSVWRRVALCALPRLPSGSPDSRSASLDFGNDDRWRARRNRRRPGGRGRGKPRVVFRPVEPFRLSYSLIACDPPKGSAQRRCLRIKVLYASGKELFLRADFRTPGEAEAYIARYNPELIGKCTHVDQLRPR